MRILKSLLKLLVGIILLLVIVGFFLPAKVHVERTVTIQAAPEAIYRYLIDFKEFNKWSPWFARDPATKYSYSGADSGVGAQMEWSSTQSDVGSGRQEITAAIPNQEVHFALDFGDGSPAMAKIVLKNDGATTQTTWGFDTDFGNNLMGRYLGLAFDRFIGPDYEQGLNNLKRLVESAPAPLLQTAPAAPDMVAPPVAGQPADPAVAPTDGTAPGVPGP